MSSEEIGLSMRIEFLQGDLERLVDRVSELERSFERLSEKFDYEILSPASERLNRTRELIEQGYELQTSVSEARRQLVDETRRLSGAISEIANQTLASSVINAIANLKPEAPAAPTRAAFVSSDQNHIDGNPARK